MTYTAEQLRRDAIAIERMHGETLTMEWRTHQASQLRAHADALEENARLRAELAKLRQHAEAMADDLDRFAAQPDYDGPLYGPMPSLIAYRADFPGGEMSETPRTVELRITDYLCGGGLFNPELANHDAVRDLLIDARDALTAERERADRNQEDAERYRWLRDTDTAVVAWIEEDGPRWSIEGRDGHKITRDKLDAAIDAARRKQQ